MHGVSWGSQILNSALFIWLFPYLALLPYLDIACSLVKSRKIMIAANTAKANCVSAKEIIKLGCCFIAGHLCSK